MASLVKFLSLCQADTSRGDEKIIEVLVREVQHLAAAIQLDWKSTQALMVDGRHPLVEACRAGNLSVVEMFVKNGASLNILDSQGTTPLYAAIIGRHCSLEDIRQLLSWGANVNFHRDEKLPLLASFYSTSREVSQLLIQEGADVNNVVLTCFCYMESVFALNSTLVMSWSGMQIFQDSTSGLVSLAFDIVLAGLQPKTFYMSSSKRIISIVGREGEIIEMEEESLMFSELAALWRLQHLCLCLGFKVDRRSLKRAIVEMREHLQRIEGAVIPTDTELVASADLSVARYEESAMQHRSSPAFVAQRTGLTRETGDFAGQNVLFPEGISEVDEYLGNFREVTRICKLKNKLSQLLWIRQFQVSPMPLTYLTRVAIRSHLAMPAVSRGRHIEKAVAALPIPRMFKNFLAPKGYKEIDS